MRNRIGILILGLVLILGIGIWILPDAVGAMGGPVPKPKPTGLLLDDFEDGEYRLHPAWWVFDNVSPEVMAIDSEKNALLIKGATKIDWYCGGLGTYFARPGVDLAAYRNLQLDIYGFGPGQGTLKIELFDDDNNNWDLEQNTAEAFAPLSDDRFVKELLVDWVGWKRIVLPFAEFKDDNLRIGDDVWNPGQTDQSGGLLQLQFICIASRKVGSLQYAVDNVSLTK